MALESINPATGELIETFLEMTPEQTAEVINDTAVAFTGWRQTTFAERSRLMYKAAEVLRLNADKYARNMALEMASRSLKGGLRSKNAQQSVSFMRIMPKHF